MLVIASNITTRNPAVARVFRKRVSGCENAEAEASAELQDLALDCLKAGAEVLEINLQQHFDSPEAMEFAVNAVQQAGDVRLCLSAGKAETLEAGLRLCRQAPIINYVTFETYRLEEFLPLAAKYGCELVLLVSEPSRPGDARQMLEKAAILVGAANNKGIPAERLIVDPGIYHITTEQGQRHLAEVMEFFKSVSEAFEPPVRTTCWLGNSSAGAPAKLRPLIETLLLARLSGLGLSSVFLDILRKENRRALHLMKIFDNQEIYADSLLEI